MAGSRAYVFELRLYGKTIRITIGDPRATGPGKARAEAGRLKTVVDSGKDLREVRAEQQLAYEVKRRKEERSAVTFSDARDA